MQRQGERFSLAPAVTQEALHVELTSSARAVIKHTRQFGSSQQRLQRQVEHISPCLAVSQQALHLRITYVQSVEAPVDWESHGEWRLRMVVPGRLDPNGRS